MVEFMPHSAVGTTALIAWTAFQKNIKNIEARC